ncbi:MAG: hypothetical protein JXL80_14255 [Planctomycetes bacterium]|nr:hypothetical protein [Planctomycetota bacterium]
MKTHWIHLAGLAVLVLAAAGSAQAGPPFYVGAYEADHEFERITAADMEIIRTKHVLLGSRSFGLCIMSGISSLASTNPIYQLNRSPTYDVNNGGDIPTDVYDNFDFVHYLCTLNPTYSTRLAEMDNFIRNRYHEQLDAVMVEYHFCDAATFPTYQAMLDGWRQDFPNMKIIYVTSGYMIDSVYHASNQDSAQFGALTRAAYVGTQPFYDMGNMLGTDSSGVWQGDFLCPEFNLNYPNGDNMHPNTPFATERLGKAMLLVLYKMFCELPLRADAGDDQFVVDDDSDGSCTVTLDGSGSFCQDGELVSYVWKEGSTVIATGETAEVSLAYGTHTVNLFVTDDEGNTDRDDVQIIAKASSIHVVYQVAASTDDTQFTETSNSVTSSVLMWPYNYGLRRSGMRWAVNIPAGSTILEAKVTACSDGRNDVQNSPILQMNLFDYDDCPAFTATPWTWPVTANSVTWIMEESPWLEGQWYESPNIASIVQEFIDRSGYAPGRHLGLRGMGARPSGTIGWHYVYQWDYGDHDRGAKLDILYAEPEPNHAPVAEAGPNQLLHDTDRTGWVVALLDGRGSSDSDGTITSYIWKEGATPIATGEMTLVVLPTGVHSITLVVTDNEGATGSDAVVLHLNAPPTADAGPDQTVQADGTGFALVTFDGSASFDSDGNLVDWRWDDGPVFLGDSGVAVRQFSLGVGVHTVTLTVADEDSATGQDTVVITVNAPSEPPVISAALDVDWVYQNTPHILTNGGHSVKLEVAVEQWGSNESVTVTVEKVAGSGSGEVTIENDPEGNPLVRYVYGGLRSDGVAGTGVLTLRVTATGDVAGEDTFDVPMTVRRLGDIDGNGGAEPGDMSALINKLNGLDTSGFLGRAFDLDANGGAEPGDLSLLINILNALPIS